jgi:hypothetical protein
MAFEGAIAGVVGIEGGVVQPSPTRDSGFCRRRSSRQLEIETAEHPFANWLDRIEAGVRDRAPELLEGTFEGELNEVLSRPR